MNKNKGILLILIAVLAAALCVLTACAHKRRNAPDSLDSYEYSMSDGELIITGIYDKNVKKINVPEGVTQIGDSAFWGCKNLQSATLPSTVTKIGVSAFYSCGELTDVSIPSSVTHIGECAFYKCTKLANISVPESVSSIDRSAFEGTAWFDNQPGGIVYAGSVAYTYKGSMPQNTSLRLRNGIKSITSLAFDGYGNLVDIDIPESVETIGNSAFRNCHGLTSLILPNSLTSIGYSAFDGCDGLEEITIPDKVEKIASGAFYGCNKLNKVNIRDLTKWCMITFDNEVANPLYYAHALYIDGNQVTDLTIPDEITDIKRFTFYGYSSLSSLTVGNQVESIGNYAFTNCDGLDIVNISDLESWCKITFENVSANPMGCASNLYLNGQIVTKLRIPATVTEIKNYTFLGCTSITEIVIPSSLKTIKSRAFANCSNLEVITVNRGITSIDYEAFGYCSALREIRFVGTKAQWNAINKGTNWDNESTRYSVYCDDGVIS